MKADKDVKQEAAKQGIYIRPKLINRHRCYIYKPEGGCLYCGNKTFRYYCTVCDKRYYQCEACRGINH